MSEQTFIPLSVPNFAGNERAYANEAVVSEWVSSGGAKVAAFEEAFARAVGAARAVACNAGTAGLHLAMLCAEVAGCEVITPALTFIAATNPIRYAGAQPVFIGCDDTLCIDPGAVERFCAESCEMRGDALYNKRSGARVAALEVVHVFGNLADMERLADIAARYHLTVIEDATEAVGSYYTTGRYAGRHAGTIGDVGVYSFNGNKLITTGSGGMLVSRHESWAQRAKHLSTQAKTDEVQFFHDEVGYNYRLTNLQAALGLAQLEQLETFIARKHALYDRYRDALDGRCGLRILPFREGTRPNKWFFSLVLEAYPLRRDELIAALTERRIQTRPIWALIHEQPPYRDCEAHDVAKAEYYRERIVNLPCSTNLADADVDRVIGAVLELGEK